MEKLSFEIEINGVTKSINSINDAAPTEEPSDDIIVTKSILFKDEIKGAALLVEFLKKLDLS